MSAHSASSEELAATPATSTSPVAGVLWVTTSVMKPEIKSQLLDDWYDEHKTDVLDCAGNGGLFLRYKNLDKSITSHADPKFSDRFAPTASVKNIADAGWPYLALVKLSDLDWLTSKQFIDMPRVSKQLPLESDGSIGSAFSNFHAALRSYRTIKYSTDITPGEKAAQYILSIQSEATDDATWDALDKKYTALPGFRRAIKYQNVDGLLEYQEPGQLPKTLVLYEYDGEQAPTLDDTSRQVRTDIWEFTHAWGDLNLSL